MSIKNQIGAMAARILSVALLFGGAAASARSDQASLAESKMAAGDELADRGQFQEAIARWEEAGRAFAKAKDVHGGFRALLHQAAVCHTLGQHRLALRALANANALVNSSKDAHSEEEVRAARGAVSIFGWEADQAEDFLRTSLQEAKAAHDTALVATIQNDLGILLSAHGQTADALAAFKEAVANGDAVLAAKATKNMTDAAFAAQDYAAAERFADQTVKAASALPDGHKKAFLLMGVGEVFQDIFVNAPDHNNELRARAFKLDQEAEKIAEKTGDLRALTFALGDQGALYEFEKRYPEALTLTRHALFVAQQVQSPEALYLWQWQTGRLLSKTGERDAAIEAYRRTIATLKTIRNDIALRRGNANAHSSFREAVGGVYFELADLLLQRADATKDDKEVQKLLGEARDTAESLKAAELEDYFQDDCVNLLKSKSKKVENVSPTAAVIYIIALPTRTELLVSLAAGRLERFKADVRDEELTETARLFRQNLEDQRTTRYRIQAKQLYTWLIKPLEPLIAKAHLDTLVFVPDGALRTVPMAALYDGEKFLIEKYAVAVTPGLELMEAKVAERMEPHVMVRGLSEATEGFPALANVPEEVAEVKKLYAGSDASMNAEFKHDSTGEKLQKEPFTIVHIASHGHFDSDVEKSFVLTFDKHLTLDDLETYIRPSQLRDHPLELLTLSACETARGDDRAALGLAGIAVKAGARSAFATLWCIADGPTTQLIGDFYSELRQHPQLNKAQALQVAQKKLLAQYPHPCFWAPYLIIGNWL